MDKESGVYLTITDNSFQTPGTSSMKVLVPMVTTKGKLGLNLVNANNFKDILGYDLNYNSNYYGLGNILESLSYAYVWRINQDAKLANAYFADTSSDKSSDENIETFEDLINKDPKPALAISLKDVGNPGVKAIKFIPTPNETTIMNINPTGSTPQEIVFEDVSETEVSTYNQTEIKGGCIFYNLANNSIIGIIKPNYEDELRVYRVIDGDIFNDVMETITANTWKGGDTFYSSDGSTMEEPEGDPAEPVSLGNVRRTTYEVTTDHWKCGDKFYGEDTGVEPTPSGTAGTETVLCEAYAAGASDTVPPGIYVTDDNGTTFYKVTKFGETFVEFEKEGVNEDVAIALATKYTGDEFSNLSLIPYTDNVDTGFYQNKSGSWFKVLSFSTTMIVLNSFAETNEDIIVALELATDIEIDYIKYSKTVLAEDNSCGTAEWEEAKLTVTLVKALSKDSYWNVKTIPVAPTEWTLNVADYIENQYRITNTVSFSTNSESDIYWNKLDFNEIDIYIDSNIPLSWTAVRNYFTLDNGSNGSTNLIAAELDMSVIDNCGCNTIAMNGITNYKLINKIAQRGEKFFIHTYGDAPAFSDYGALEEWNKNIYRSEYLVIGGRPDQVEIAEDEYIYVYPSVNYIAILSRMESQYQCLYYPPAGFTYGTIAIENLITCDYDKYGDELKTNRINWQRTLNRGSVMWEQRTTYALDSDLSYIAPVYIIDGLREQLIDFESQFTFRYMSPTDLLNQENGIRSILDDFVTKGFIYQYDLSVPTYAEAQAAGRVLTIKVGVTIAKDSEVIYINININNAQ